MGAGFGIRYPEHLLYSANDISDVNSTRFAVLFL